MRRIGRTLLNTLTVLALLMCAATAVFWVRSYFARDEIWRTSYQLDGRTYWDRQVAVGTVRGGVFVIHRLHRYDLRPEVTAAQFDRFVDEESGFLRITKGTSTHSGDFVQTPTFWNRLGFYKLRSSWGTPPPPSDWKIIVPFWSIMPAAALPALRLRGWYRRRRSGRAGRCASCGYDLRATPDRCPECGASNANVGECKAAP